MRADPLAWHSLGAIFIADGQPVTMQALIFTQGGAAGKGVTEKKTDDGKLQCVTP